MLPGISRSRLAYVPTGSGICANSYGLTIVETNLHSQLQTGSRCLSGSAWHGMSCLVRLLQMATRRRLVLCWTTLIMQQQI
ncbi:hypothetical protein JG687_00010678 [Phytophthora cactorum]|uniref:Uncharacterized protein n=1 Tax=Phytophthora cactorum TaxID=29920 RepID=A0A8T1U8U7_9STRA|nr:hypothetical protein JG687_00010678 [Phytophthora cactorum]